MTGNDTSNVSNDHNRTPYRPASEVAKFIRNELKTAGIIATVRCIRCGSINEAIHVMVKSGSYPVAVAIGKAAESVDRHSDGTILSGGNLSISVKLDPQLRRELEDAILPAITAACTASLLDFGSIQPIAGTTYGITSHGRHTLGHLWVLPVSDDTCKPLFSFLLEIEVARYLITH